MLGNRTEVMMHTVVPRNINLENFDRQVLVGVRRAGKVYVGLLQHMVNFTHRIENLPSMIE